MTSLSQNLSPWPPEIDEQGRVLTVRADWSYYYRKVAKKPRDLPANKGYCPACEEIKDIALFTSKTGKIAVYCPDCRNQKERARYTAESGRQRNLQRNYGLTKEEYERKLAQQGGVCACCGKPETVINGRTKRIQHLSTDHNHKTHGVRDLLCNACNRIVGLVESEFDRIPLAMAYLEKHGIQ